MAYLKPQSPIKNGEDHIYPLTTYDQIIMNDGSRWDGNVTTDKTLTQLDRAADAKVVGDAIANHYHNYATTATYSGTLTSGGWSNSAPYSQTVTVSGILATDTPFADVNMSSASTGDAGNNLIEAWSFVGRITVTADNTIVAYCYDEKPTINIPFVLKVVR